MSPSKSQKAAVSKLDQYRRQDREEQAENDGDNTHGEERTAGDTEKLLEAINLCRTSLASQIEEVKVDISLIRQDFHKLRDRVKETETRISDMEDTIPPMRTEVHHMKQQIQQLFSKQEDLENRSRRCNLRLIGLPEGAEGKDPTLFLEQLLIKTYGREAFSPMLAVERAHRMPARPPPQGAPPRTFIAKMLNYRDRDAALRLARERGNIPLGNVKIAVFPDFSAKVQRRRQNFMEAKRKLRSLNMKYAMLFPARLRVEHDGRVSFFEDPAELMAWLERRNNLEKAD